jgi:hypothetical protein
LAGLGNAQFVKNDGRWGPITRGAVSIALVQLGASGTVDQNVTGAVRATTVNMQTAVWTRIQQLAEGRVDSCSGSAGTRTGSGDTTGGGGTTDTGGGGGGSPDTSHDLPQEETGAWYSNPLVWLGAAALAGIGYYVYTSGGETPSEASYAEDSIPSSVTFPV